MKPSQFGVRAWAMALSSRRSLTPQPSRMHSTTGRGSLVSAIGAFDRSRDRQHARGSATASGATASLDSRSPAPVVAPGAARPGTARERAPVRPGSRHGGGDRHRLQPQRPVEQLLGAGGGEEGGDLLAAASEADMGAETVLGDLA